MSFVQIIRYFVLSRLIEYTTYIVMYNSIKRYTTQRQHRQRNSYNENAVIWVQTTIVLAKDWDRKFLPEILRNQKAST